MRPDEENNSPRISTGAGRSVLATVFALLAATGFFAVLSLAKGEHVLSVIVGLQYCNFVTLLVIACLLFRRAWI